MKPKPIEIKHKGMIKLFHSNFFLPEDIEHIDLKAQEIDEDYAFNPEASVVFANTSDMCVVVHLAKCVNGLIYTGREIEHGDEYTGCYPSHNDYYDKGHRTIREALISCLDHLQKHFRSLQREEDNILIKTFDSGIINLRRRVPVQMTIFDILETN